MRNCKKSLPSRKDIYYAAPKQLQIGELHAEVEILYIREGWTSTISDIGE